MIDLRSASAVRAGCFAGPMAHPSPRPSRIQSTMTAVKTSGLQRCRSVGPFCPAYQTRTKPTARAVHAARSHVGTLLMPRAVATSSTRPRPMAAQTGPGLVNQPHGLCRRRSERRGIQPTSLRTAAMLRGSAARRAGTRLSPPRICTRPGGLKVSRSAAGLDPIPDRMAHKASGAKPSGTAHVMVRILERPATEDARSQYSAAARGQEQEGAAGGHGPQAEPPYPRHRLVGVEEVLGTVGQRGGGDRRRLPAGRRPDARQRQDLEHHQHEQGPQQRIDPRPDVPQRPGHERREDPQAHDQAHQQQQVDGPVAVQIAERRGNRDEGNPERDQEDRRDPSGQGCRRRRRSEHALHARTL